VGATKTKRAPRNRTKPKQSRPEQSTPAATMTVQAPTPHIDLSHVAREMYGLLCDKCKRVADFEKWDTTLDFEYGACSPCWHKMDKAGLV